MGLDVAYECIKDARKDHRGSRIFYQGSIVVVIAALIIFGIVVWKTSNYYFAFGEFLAATIKPLLNRMGKLSEINVAILHESGKIIKEASNQDSLTEEIRRQQESDRQRREE